MKEQWRCLAWAAFAISVFFVPSINENAKYIDWYSLVFAGFQFGRFVELYE